MSSCVFRQDLLNPTRWFAIICAIANAANLHEELTTLLVTKAMVNSYLSSTCRFFPEHTNTLTRMTQGLFS